MRNVFWLSTLALVVSAVATVAAVDYSRRYPASSVARCVCAVRGTPTQDPAPSSPPAVNPVTEFKGVDEGLLRDLRSISTPTSIEPPAPVTLDTKPADDEFTFPATKDAPRDGECCMCRCMARMMQTYTTWRYTVCDLMDTMSAALNAEQTSSNVVVGLPLVGQYTQNLDIPISASCFEATGIGAALDADDDDLDYHQCVLFRMCNGFSEFCAGWAQGAADLCFGGGDDDDDAVEVLMPPRVAPTQTGVEPPEVLPAPRCASENGKTCADKGCAPGCCEGKNCDCQGDDGQKAGCCEKKGSCEIRIEFRLSGEDDKKKSCCKGACTNCDDDCCRDCSGCSWFWSLFCPECQNGCCGKNCCKQDGSVKQAGCSECACCANKLTAQFYPVGDFLDCEGMSVENVIATVTKMVEPETWQCSGGKGCAVYFAPGRCLIVRQTAAVHEQVEEFMGQLREKMSGMQKTQQAPPVQDDQDNKDPVVIIPVVLPEVDVAIRPVPVPKFEISGTTVDVELKLVPLEVLSAQYVIDPAVPGFLPGVRTPENLPNCAGGCIVPCEAKGYCPSANGLPVLRPATDLPLPVYGDEVPVRTGDDWCDEEAVYFWNYVDESSAMEDEMECDHEAVYFWNYVDDEDTDGDMDPASPVLDRVFDFRPSDRPAYEASVRPF